LRANQHSGDQIDRQTEEAQRQTVTSRRDQIVHEEWIKYKADKKCPGQRESPGEKGAKAVDRKYVDGGAQEGRHSYCQVAKTE